MQPKKFSIKEMLSFTFNSILNDIGLWLLVDLCSIAIAVVAALGVTVFIAATWPPLGFQLFLLIIFSIVLFKIIYGIIALGLAQIGLDFYDHGTSSLGRLFSAKHLILNYIIASFLYAVVTAIGFMLLIVPGIIFMLLFSLYTTAMVDRNLGPIEALSESYRITKGHLLELFLVMVIALIIFALPIIGVLFGGITLKLFEVYVYRKLAK